MKTENKKYILIVLVILVVLAFIIYNLYNNSNNEMDWNNIISEETKNVKENIINNSIEEIEQIIVHITGEIKKEGVVYLNKGARLIDAIKEAGGETKEADLTQVNLAYELKDGQKIYIPNKNEQITEYIINVSGNTVIDETSNNSKGDNNKVNLNTANQEELDELPGIGPAIAQSIIEYREENGNFNEIEDLQNVKGIGDSKYSKIKDMITV